MNLKTLLPLNFKESAPIISTAALIIATLALIRPQTHLVSFIGSSKNELNLKEFVCREGMLSVLLKNPDSHFIHQALIDTLIESDFEGVGEVQNYQSLTTLDDRGLCRFITTAPIKRSFSVYLETNASAPFNFQIIDINEIPLTETL